MLGKEAVAKDVLTVADYFGLKELCENLKELKKQITDFEEILHEIIHIILISMKTYFTITIIEYLCGFFSGPLDYTVSS